MAGYKITKKDGTYVYTAPGHNECKCTRLHDPQDVDNGRLINGITHFLPYGGGTDFAANPAESIYFILKGEMTFKGEDGVETVLTEGDSVHIAGGSPKCVTNTGCTVAEMHVILLPPEQK